MVVSTRSAIGLPSGIPTFSGNSKCKYGQVCVPTFSSIYRDPCFRRLRSMYPGVRAMPAGVEESKCKLETPQFTVTQLPPVPKSEFYTGSVIHSEEVASGIRCITVEVEISRELVHIDDAYTRPGQLAQVRVGDGEVLRVPVSSSPFSKEANWIVLYKMRGDMPSGYVKPPNSTLSVKAPLQLHVTQSHHPILYQLQQGDGVEVGPFEATGLDLRPVLFISGFPTAVFFTSGRGIAVVRAIIEAREGDNGSIGLGFRDQVRLYYSAPDPTLIAYMGKFQEWEQKKVQIRTTVSNTGGQQWDGFVGSFTNLWDEDDIEYDPNTTAAIVCVEDDARNEIKDLLSDAGIPDKQVVYWDASL